MTVAKLIKLLSKHDPKRLVVLSRDSEGNGFSPLSDISPLRYHTDDQQVSDDTDPYPGAKAALVLWP